MPKPSQESPSPLPPTVDDVSPDSLRTTAPTDAPDAEGLLAALPEQEREGWKRLWVRVEALRKKVEGKSEAK